MSTTLKPGQVADIPVSELQRDPRQPRKHFDPASLEQLATSLKQRVEVPLLVRLEGERIVIVDGERRWRAAKLAKLKTVPCLLAAAGEQLDIATTQLTTATQRENLKPLEIAEFVVDLQKRHKKSMNELLAALAERGIKEIGQAKIERFLRLLELPEWAQVHLREGTFTEAHGQALLQAVVPGNHFARVLGHVRDEVERVLKWKGGITVAEVREKVEHGFRVAGTDLNSRSGRDEDRRLFPIEPCRACEFYKKIGGAEYCLNRKEFDKKQTEALQLKAARAAKKAPAKSADPVDETDPTKVAPRQVKVTADNVVALRRLNRTGHEPLSEAHFDKTDCQTCPHRHLASHAGTAAGAEDYCFHPPCYLQKEIQATRQLGRTGKLREYLDAWLRPHVAREAVERLDEAQSDGIVLWLATGALDRKTRWYTGQMHDKAARALLPWIEKRGLRDLPAIMDFAEHTLKPADWAELICAGVEVMTRPQLRWFAHLLKIDITQAPTLYRIDEAYLKMKRKVELQKLWQEAGFQSPIAQLGAGELRSWCLEANAREKIGVPHDLLLLYREPFLDEEEEDDDEAADSDLEEALDADALTESVQALESA